MDVTLDIKAPIPDSENIWFTIFGEECQMWPANYRQKYRINLHLAVQQPTQKLDGLDIFCDDRKPFELMHSKLDRESLDLNNN